jgi:RNA polymerase sigma factor (sigma-70 family)
MKSLICILLFTQFLSYITSLYLTNYQIQLINNLVQNPLLQSKERESINKILYKAYENWAVKKALDFKTLHKYKCVDIKTNELILYSKFGLFKSIKKYNGKYNFINYSSIYIKSELLRALTEKYSLSILPKSYRTKNKSTLTENELIIYNRLLHTQLTCQYNKNENNIFVNNNDILNKINKKYEDEERFNEKMNSLTAFEKRVLQLKYNHNYENNFIRSNKDVAILMCCSEETIRKITASK